VKRRSFIAGSAVLFGASRLSLAEGDFATIEYTPGLIEEKLAAGETVLVDYAREENPAFDENISFVKVDWDTYNTHEVTTSRKIPRRSTLLLLRGEEELGRIVAGTNSDAIRRLLTLAIADS